MHDQSQQTRSRGNTGPVIPPADSAMPGWLEKLPVTLLPYALLARLDRPVGIGLLLLPCYMGLVLPRIKTGFAWIDLLWVVLFFFGAVIMRGAGCTWNDIRDRNLDAKVERTAGRPLPSGQVSVPQACLFLIVELILGGLIWLCLPQNAKLWALAALPLAAAYPFMKRLTWWPQAWLGVTFNSGLVIGMATVAPVSAAGFLVYAGLVFWTIAYDTIYAIQDRKDDEIAGIKSTARLFGRRVLSIVFVCQTVAAALITVGMHTAGSKRLAMVTGTVFFLYTLWQVLWLAGNRQERALPAFKSSFWAGTIVLAGMGLSVIVHAP